MSTLLDSHIPICDAIAALLRPHAEVVLHELATDKIFYIANAFSKRRIGDASLIEPGTKLDGLQDVIGPYSKINWDGRRLKSVSTIIRDGRRKPVGLLCINQHIDAFSSAIEQLKNLIELPVEPVPAQPLISHDWRERINSVIGAFLRARKVALAGLDSSDLDEVIGELDRNSIFDIRRAVPYVAEVLQLSRATIYNRLAAIRARVAQTKRSKKHQKKSRRK